MEIEFTTQTAKRSTDRGHMTTETDLIVYVPDHDQYYAQTDITPADALELAESFDADSDEWVELDYDRSRNSDGTPRSVHSGPDRSDWTTTRTIDSAPSDDRDEGDDGDEFKVVDSEIRQDPDKHDWNYAVVTLDDGSVWASKKRDPAREVAEERAEDFDPEGRWEQIEGADSDDDGDEGSGSEPHYAVLYGAEGSTDYDLDAPYDSVEAAHDASDARLAAEYGGSQIVEAEPCTVDHIDDYEPGAVVEDDPVGPADLLREAADAYESADALRLARELLGWTRREMSKRLGLSVTDDGQSPTLRDWERGRRWPQDEGRKRMRALADILDADDTEALLAHVSDVETPHVVEAARLDREWLDQSDWGEAGWRDMPDGVVVTLLERVEDDERHDDLAAVADRAW